MLAAFFLLARFAWFNSIKFQFNTFTGATFILVPLLLFAFSLSLLLFFFIIIIILVAYSLTEMWYLSLWLRVLFTVMTKFKYSSGIEILNGLHSNMNLMSRADLFAMLRLVFHPLNSTRERTYLILFCECAYDSVLLSTQKQSQNTKAILLTSITHPITMISYSDPLDYYL